MRAMTTQQQLEAKEIGRKYNELKNLRNNLIREKMLEVEAEVESAREEFADYLQHVYERDNYPYKWNISQLATAMGTPSGRQTVRSFLGEAVQRRATKHFTTETYELPYAIEYVDSETTGNPPHTTTWAVVSEDGPYYWDVTFDGVRYSVLTAAPNGPGIWERTSAAPKYYKSPLDTSAPEWLNWLIEQDKWKEKL